VPSRGDAVGIPISATETYDRYVRAEWALYASEPGRAAIARNAVGQRPIARVLDIGCGAGQELRPFLVNPRALGVGLDISAEVGRAGRELFAADQPASRIAFVRSPAEQLPFASATFDVVICRLALPYTDNATALGEIARVLQPGGVLLLKFHHARYYALKLREAVATGRIKSAIHACRVLAAGVIYHVTRSQPHGWLTGRETFQTMWLLRREVKRQGMEVRRVLADSVPAAPSLLIQRTSSSLAAGTASRL
jgi:ubiquinone/menaquinone biosynthesis C-methylase UbiE